MKKSNVFWGLLLLFIAAALVLDKMDMLGGTNTFSLIITVGMILCIIKSLYPVQFYGILFPIAILCILYNRQLGLEKLTPWTILLVALLTSAGLSMIFDNAGKKQRYRKAVKDNADHVWNENAQVIDEADDSYIYHKTSFGASTKYINTEHLREANLECSFGAMKIYFDKASLENGRAAVWIQGSFCGIELYVPRDWQIENHISATLGGVSEKTPKSPVGNNTLVLEGSINFAGVDIIYV